MAPAKVDKLREVLRSEQLAFDSLATEPNTLQRNLRLAAHREEIQRVSKLLQKQDKAVPQQLVFESRNRLIESAILLRSKLALDTSPH